MQNRVDEVANIALHSKRMKRSTSFRLNDGLRFKIRWLANYYGVSQTGVISMLVLDAWRRATKDTK
jgi:hypothetical protein